MVERGSQACGLAFLRCGRKYFSGRRVCQSNELQNLELDLKIQYWIFTGFRNIGFTYTVGKLSLCSFRSVLCNLTFQPIIFEKIDDMFRFFFHIFPIFRELDYKSTYWIFTGIFNIVITYTAGKLFSSSFKYILCNL